MFILTLIVLFYAREQINAARQNNDKIIARGLYRDYLRSAYECPEFGRPDFKAIVKKKKVFEKYRWYMSNALWAWEEILASVSVDREWNSALTTQILHHRDYFRSGLFQPQHYSRELRNFINDVIGKDKMHRSSQPVATP